MYLMYVDESGDPGLGLAWRIAHRSPRGHRRSLPPTMIIAALRAPPASPPGGSQKAPKKWLDGRPEQGQQGIRHVVDLTARLDFVDDPQGVRSKWLRQRGELLANNVGAGRPRCAQ